MCVPPREQPPWSDKYIILKSDCHTNSATVYRFPLYFNIPATIHNVKFYGLTPSAVWKEAKTVRPAELKIRSGLWGAEKISFGLEHMEFPSVM